MDMAISAREYFSVRSGSLLCAIAVDELNGKASEFLKIPQYICDSGFRYKGENAGYHSQHLMKEQRTVKKDNTVPYDGIIL